MNKKFMNKKGLDSMKTVAMIILILLLLGVYLYFTSQAAQGGGSFMDNLRGSKHDFDGDGTPDIADKCPCGSPPNMKNHVDFFNGIEKCVQQLDPCAEEFEEYGFTTAEDSRGRKVCTYHKNQCMNYIEDFLKK